MFGLNAYQPVRASRVITTALVAVFLVSCAHQPELTEPDAPPVTVPETYSLYGETAPAPDRWWETFGSGELSGLVEGALAGSLTLQQAWYRLEQARASAAAAGASRLPDLTLNAGVSESVRNVDGEAVDSSSRTLNLASRWEIDFWGEISARQRAALLTMEASRADLHSAAQTLAAETTLTWLEIIAARQELALLAEQIEVNQTILDLLKLRYLKGMANALDIYQQRQVLAGVKADVPTVESRLLQLGSQLAVLTGKPPRTDLGIAATRFPDPGTLPDPGIPADLLARRPDVRAEGLKLRSAESQLAAARAARLPSVVLSGTAGFSSETFRDLFENWLLTLAANLSWTLLDSGELDAEADLRQAVADERLAAYGQAVLTAMAEVEDALAGENKQQEYIEALREQLDISEAGLREAESRYRKGLSDFLPVLTALTSSQRLERSLVRAELDRLTYRVSLHRALGGGWMSEVEAAGNRSR